MTAEQHRALAEASRRIERARHRLAVHEAWRLASTEHVRVELDAAARAIKTASD